MNSERPFILCFLTNNDIGFYSAGLDCKIKAILTIFVLVLVFRKKFELYYILKITVASNQAPTF